MKQLLDNINSPLDIKDLTIESLPTLSKEVNKYIRETIMTNQITILKNISLLSIYSRVTAVP